MKMSGALPKENRNGLAARGSIMLGDPQSLHVAIVIFRTSRILEDVETGEREPTVRIVRVEPVLPQDAMQAEKLLRRALEHREGVATLPIEIEDEIAEAFREAAFDRTSGEMFGEES
ncbi:MAG: hypothetical protein ACLGHM_09730 [Actinomycetes bacterium]